eukprot:UN03135
MWLWNHHPLTLIANLELIPELNYFKSLLQILERVLKGEEWVVKRNVAFSNKLVGADKRTKGGFPAHKMPILDTVANGRYFLKRFESDPLFRALFNKIAVRFCKCTRKGYVSVRK